MKYFREKKIRILTELNVDLQKLFAELTKTLNEEITNAGRTHRFTEKDNIDLDLFGRDLTEMAKEDKFDPIIGRDKEMKGLCRF